MTSSAPIERVGAREFVALIAAIMAMTGLGIDTMLPALPAIANELGVSHPNERQWVISAFMLGFGSTQLIYGPLSDRFGRKPVLITGMLLFGLTSFAASFATSFPLLVLLRLLQGMAAAGGRVLSTSIVRDRFSGHMMARTMSLAFMIFMVVPILAPALGQLILSVAQWRAIFDFLGLFGVAVALWLFLRIPETLRPEHRRGISPGVILMAVRETLAHRRSIGYALAGTLLFGSLMGYLNSFQQILDEALHAPHLLAIIFALAAIALAVASFINARLVSSLGSRRISQFALVGFIAMIALHLGWALLIGETVLSFTLFQCVTMFWFGLCGPNFSALAMEPMGHIAGTASSVQGTISTLGAATIGILIGQLFDGSVIPLLAGGLACGIAALALISFVERDARPAQ